MEHQLFTQEVYRYRNYRKDNLKARILFLVTCLSTYIFFRFILNITSPIIGIFIVIIPFLVRDDLNPIAYEYSFDGTFFNVDCIFTKKKKTKLHSFNLSECPIFESTDSTLSEKYSHYKIADLTSGEKNINTYTIIGNSKNKPFRFLIEPNQEMIDRLKDVKTTL